MRIIKATKEIVKEEGKSDQPLQDICIDLGESDIDDIEDWNQFDEFEEDIKISGSERVGDDYQEGDDNGTKLIFKDQLQYGSLNIKESFLVMRDEEFFPS
ncbi:hypothetical protein BY996DRAFT_6593103 [Phakopsora pachyrhizi]|uniref:Uncharacterized protein n=1 Tax=Phakopsora pachyrhizi TaxID=170000 RepID=A0AAV0AVZ7_PHAPC|nr:hypothetical protein BY996DRAFT_6593103 [Phakopsora pachyrhizi]CAH7674231.1 hypothetical protein PPACK8108_LOCUS9143 [Phakopsora pachyrhizi]